jgi:hypothetical protein
MCTPIVPMFLDVAVLNRMHSCTVDFFESTNCMDYNLGSVEMRHLLSHSAYVTTAAFNSEDPEDGGNSFLTKVCLLLLNIIMKIRSRRM